MESSAGNEQCSIQCPNCGVVFTKSLEWLANHRSYICGCGAAMDALKIHMDKEMKTLDKAIEEVNMLKT